MRLSIKQFASWFTRKQFLHNQVHKPPFVSEGGIWWVGFGENIGSEMNGKSVKFTRPAIVLKKLAHGFYLVAPTTTKPRVGSWYVHIRHAGIDEYACLHQIRIIDYRRLSDKIGQINIADFQKIKTCFLKLYN